MFSINKAASQFGLQISLVAILALGVGLVAFGNPLSEEVSASDFSPDRVQLEALSDRVVTRAEYDIAIGRTVACIEKSGAVVEGLRYEGYRNAPVTTFVVKNSSSYSPKDGPSPYDICRMKHSRAVENAWVDQGYASVTSEKKSADEQAALACATEEGLQVNSIDELRELRRLGSHDNQGGVSRCATIAQDGYDMNEHPPIGAPEGWRAGR